MSRTAFYWAIVEQFKCFSEEPVDAINDAIFAVLLVSRDSRQAILITSRSSSNRIWSYDFVTDSAERGRQLRMLCVLDEFTRESLAIEVRRSFTARQVVDVLGYLFAVRGSPEHIRSDNGPEFVAGSVRRWLDRMSLSYS